MSKKKALLMNALLAIHDQIDYSIVEAYYHKNQWMWAIAVPNSRDLSQQVLYFIDKLVMEKHSCISSGGISVHSTPGQLKILFGCHGNSCEVWYGQSHDELSPLSPVTDYFEYMQKRYDKKAAMKRKVS